MNIAGEFEVVVVALCERSILDRFVQYCRSVGASNICVFLMVIRRLNFPVRM